MLRPLRGNLCLNADLYSLLTDMAATDGNRSIPRIPITPGNPFDVQN